MKTNEYLYGVGVTIKPIPEEVVSERIQLLNKNLELLLTVHYMEQDTDRIRAITRAIFFWENISNE